MSFSLSYRAVAIALALAMAALSSSAGSKNVQRVCTRPPRGVMVPQLSANTGWQKTAAAGGGATPVPGSHGGPFLNNNFAGDSLGLHPDHGCEPNS